MKSLSLISILFLFLIGCKENQNPEQDTATVTEVEVAPVEVAPVEEFVSPIPVLDFSELEQAYLQVDTDTTYVVNFWATWCKPCVKELPAFEQLREAHQNDNLKVVLVSLDFPEKLKSGVIPFVEKRGIESEVVLLDDPDANSWIPKVSEKWSGAIPATVIVTKEGSKFYERSFTYEELEQEITSL